MPLLTRPRADFAQSEACHGMQGAPYWRISLHIILAAVLVQESGQDIVRDEPAQRQAWTEVAAHVSWGP